MSRPSTLERAFEIANSGRVSSIIELRYVLLREGYDVEQLQGPVLKKQIIALMERARMERLQFDLGRKLAGSNRLRSTHQTRVLGSRR